MLSIHRTDWNHIDKNPTQFLRRYHCQKNHLAEPRDCPVQDLKQLLECPCSQTSINRRQIKRSLHSSEIAYSLMSSHLCLRGIISFRSWSQEPQRTMNLGASPREQHWSLTKKRCPTLGQGPHVFKMGLQHCYVLSMAPCLP